MISSPIHTTIRAGFIESDEKNDGTRPGTPNEESSSPDKSGNKSGSNSPDKSGNSSGTSPENFEGSPATSAGHVIFTHSTNVTLNIQDSTSELLSNANYVAIPKRLCELSGKGIRVGKSPTEQSRQTAAITDSTGGNNRQDPPIDANATRQNAAPMPTTGSSPIPIPSDTYFKWPKPLEIPPGKMDEYRRTCGEKAVFLHVYDLDSMTAQINRLAMILGNAGVFHVGVEVFGDEWYYRQGDDHETGIVMSKPMTHEAHAYRQSFYLGESKYEPRDFWNMLIDLKAEWKCNDYKLLTNNCHTFAQHLCSILEVAPLPDFVTNLPSFVTSHFGVPDEQAAGEEGRGEESRANLNNTQSGARRKVDPHMKWTITGAARERGGRKVDELVEERRRGTPLGSTSTKKSSPVMSETHDGSETTLSTSTKVSTLSCDDNPEFILRSSSPNVIDSKAGTADNSNTVFNKIESSPFHVDPFHTRTSSSSTTSSKGSSSCTTDIGEKKQQSGESLPYTIRSKNYACGSPTTTAGSATNLSVGDGESTIAEGGSLHTFYMPEDEEVYELSLLTGKPEQPVSYPSTNVPPDPSSRRDSKVSACSSATAAVDNGPQLAQHEVDENEHDFLQSPDLFFLDETRSSTPSRTKDDAKSTDLKGKFKFERIESTVRDKPAYHEDLDDHVYVKTISNSIPSATNLKGVSMRARGVNATNKINGMRATKIRTTLEPQILTWASKSGHGAPHRKGGNGESKSKAPRNPTLEEPSGSYDDNTSQTSYDNNSLTSFDNNSQTSYDKTSQTSSSSSQNADENPAQVSTKFVIPRMKKNKFQIPPRNKFGDRFGDLGGLPAANKITKDGIRPDGMTRDGIRPIRQREIPLQHNGGPHRPRDSTDSFSTMCSLDACGGRPADEQWYDSRYDAKSDVSDTDTIYSNSATSVKDEPSTANLFWGFVSSAFAVAAGGHDGEASSYRGGGDGERNTRDRVVMKTTVGRKPKSIPIDPSKKKMQATFL